MRLGAARATCAFRSTLKRVQLSSSAPAWRCNGGFCLTYLIRFWLSSKMARMRRMSPFSICAGPKFAIAERSVITKTGEVLFHYKWSDPRFLNLSIGATTAPGSVVAWLKLIVCNDEFRTPLVARADLVPSHFISLSSTVSGDGDIFYLPITSEMREGNTITPIVLLQWHEDKSLTDLLLKGVVLDEPLKFRYEVVKIKLDCVEHKISFPKSEYYDETKRLVWVQVTDPSKELKRNDVQETSPYGNLLRIACGLSEAQK